jgi:hypothetical protein
MNSKDKYNKDFLSIIFTDKKIKNPAKIRRPTQTHALGSKGQALRVLRKNLHTSQAQVVFFPKTLTAQSGRLIRWLYFSFFFFFFFSFSFLGVKLFTGAAAAFSFYH